MIGSAHHEAVARVDELVLAIGPKLGAPSINRRDVVLVTGPWLAGTGSVITALRRRLPQHRFVESPRLGAGAVPTVVVFVVSAATPMTESDCALLDAAAGHTDVVIAAVTKIDLHRTWREVLAANRAKLAAHAPRYGAVPWVGVAAAPQLGPPGVDDLVATVRTELAAPDIARRNRLRAWHAGLLLAGQRFNRDAAGAGRRARVDGLREERGSVLQRRRQDRTGRTIALRGQIQQARVQLCYFARSRCASVRTELQEDIAGLARRRLADFQSYARGRIDEIVTEVGDGITAQLVDVSREMSLPVDFPPADPLPAVAMPAPPLASRRLETRLMMVLGVGFGLGVALTLSRLLAGLAPGLDLGLTLAGILGCVVVGLAVALWVVRTRACSPTVRCWNAGPLTCCRRWAARWSNWSPAGCLPPKHCWPPHSGAATRPRTRGRPRRSAPSTASCVSMPGRRLVPPRDATARCRQSGPRSRRCVRNWANRVHHRVPLRREPPRPVVGPGFRDILRQMAAISGVSEAF